MGETGVDQTSRGGGGKRVGEERVAHEKSNQTQRRPFLLICVALDCVASKVDLNGFDPVVVVARRRGYRARQQM